MKYVCYNAKNQKTFRICQPNHVFNVLCMGNCSHFSHVKFPIWNSTSFEKLSCFVTALRTPSMLEMSKLKWLLLTFSFLRYNNHILLSKIGFGKLYQLLSWSKWMIQLNGTLLWLNKGRMFRKFVTFLWVAN